METKECSYYLYSENNKNLLEIIEELRKSKNTNKILLTQKDFDTGTYRITKGGIYCLQEDIEFSPNSNIYTSIDGISSPNVLDNFHPQESQKNEYPTPPYQFGFFAAITIECDNVIIDLNGHVLKQSRMHYFNQRFYSNIELNPSPFIRGQGPADFGKLYFPQNICIRNGTLGLSSHHGIHGNGNKNILLENLVIKDFEVAGLHLNGSENVVARRIDIQDISRDVQVNFLYSNALYTRRFLCQLYKENPDAFLNINGSDKKTVETILNELQTEMIEKVYLPLLYEKDVTSDLFYNKSLLPEGNIYGIVLNRLGVVVGDFVKTYEDNNYQNKDILLIDILCKNLDSFPKEIISLTSSEKPVVGTVGNTIPILACSHPETGLFIPNKQVVATCILAKYTNISDFKIHSKSLSCPPCLIDWVESEQSLSSIKEYNNLKFVNLRDQMNHFMKGNIIMFVSGGTDIRIHNIRMQNIGNSGPPCDCDPNRMSDYKYVYDTVGYINYKLSDTRYVGRDLKSFLIAGSSHIDIGDVKATSMQTNGRFNGIDILGDCNHITFNNISIHHCNKVQRRGPKGCCYSI